MIAKTDDILNDYDAYQFSVRHLKNQNKRSMRYNGGCMYRYTGEYDDLIEESFMGEPLCCAVGCLIADYAYSKEIEDLSVRYDEVVSALETSHPSWKMDEYSILLLQILQSIHDCGEPGYWDIFFDILERTVFQSGNNKLTNDELVNLERSVRNYLSIDGELHPHADIICIGRNIIEHIEVFFSNQGIVET